eukprot:1196100-Prorocentrum_minimum.AAC.2
MDQLTTGDPTAGLDTDQSDAGSAGVFSQWTNRMQEVRVYSHDRIRCRREGRARHGCCRIDR